MAISHDESVIGRDRPAASGDAVRPGDEAICERILESVADYVPHLRKSARDVETLRRVPEEIIADLAGFGVFKMATPTEYGGYALTPSQQHRIVTEIARGCGSTAWVAWVTETATQWMQQFDQRFQDELFAPDWAGPRTAGVANQAGPGAARPVEGGYMLKGKWPFCSGGHHAMFLLLGAIARDGDDVEPIICMVPNGEVVIRDDWTVMGLCGTGSNTAVVEDEIFVPAHRVLTVRELAEQRRRAEKAKGLLYDVHFISLTASVNSAISLGMAKAAVELFKERIPSRGTSDGRYKQQSEAPVTHLQLGELHCKLLSAELIARNNVEAVEAWARAQRGPDEKEFSRAKLETAYVAKTASEITTLVLRAAGASSIHQNSPFQRLYRDTQVTTMHRHTNIETCYEEFGRAETGFAEAAGDVQV